MVSLKVAVTGGVACGKTTVCQLFQKFGAQVVSADQIVHTLLSQNRQVQEKVVALLGEAVREEDTLNRATIAEIVFQNPEKLQRLEALLHPLVLEEIEHGYAKRQKEGGLFVAEIPLLFESNSERKFDKVIAVVAPNEVTEKRNPLFQRRASFQMDPLEKAKRADFVIQNDQSLEVLYENVKQLYQHLVEGEQVP